MTETAAAAVNNPNLLGNIEQLASSFGQSTPTNSDASGASGSNYEKDSMVIAKYNNRCNNDDLMRINSS